MSSAEKTPESTEKPTFKPISAVERRRLQTIYSTGTSNVEKGSIQYASEMFAHCVTADPANLVYAQSFFQTLQSKYNNNKKGVALAGLKGAGQKMALKRALTKKDWTTAIEAAVELLQLNPWDVDTLIKMASMFDEFGECEAQLFYLKAALNVDPKDPDVNRLCALALAKIGQYSQAITCWHRVEQAKPDNPEALKMIGELTIERTMPRQAAEKNEKKLDMKPGTSAKLATDAASAAPPEDEDDIPAPIRAFRELEKKLKAAIAAHPEIAGNYLELAELYANHDRYEEAENLSSQALSVSGVGEVRLLERVEEYRMLKHRHQLRLAERQAEKEQTEESKSLIKSLKKDLNRLELDIYSNRCERTPGNTAFHFELGVRLKRAGQYNEAIKNLQIALTDVSRKAMVHLELGECFQYISIHKLAMANYEKSLDYFGPKDVELRKKALYRAAVLATGLKDWDRAERFLTELAGIDYGYRDVAERLDKLPRLREDDK